MRNLLVTFGLAGALAFQPAYAAPGLAPGKPAGVHAAQMEDLVPIYGGLVLIAALLYVTIGTSGNPSTTAPVTTS